MSKIPIVTFFAEIVFLFCCKNWKFLKDDNVKFFFFCYVELRIWKLEFSFWDTFRYFANLSWFRSSWPKKGLVLKIFRVVQVNLRLRCRRCTNSLSQEGINITRASHLILVNIFKTSVQFSTPLRFLYTILIDVPKAGMVYLDIAK